MPFVPVMSAMIQAVLWDNDGVLVDTEILFFEVTRAAFATTGVTLRPEHWARSYLGQGLRSSQLAADLGLPPEVAEPMLAQRNLDYRKRLEGEIPVRKGVREVLQTLLGRVRLAIVTGSPRDQLLLMHQRTGLLDYFEFSLTSDDFTRSKPHPESYLAALQRLQLPPEACLAVEDSPRGLRSARDAGLRCALIPHALTDLANCKDATATLNDARDLLTLL